VALHALPVIRPTPGCSVGGTETRAWLFARGLARLDSTSTSFVVHGRTGIDNFVESGVQVIPRRDRLYSLYESVGHCLEKSPRFPGVRLRRFNPRLLWQVPVLAGLRLSGLSRSDPFAPDSFYEEIGADVFCTFGVQANSARVIASAHAAGRPAVLMIGSDGDLDARYAPGSDYVSQYGDVASVCLEILQRADAVVVQTPEQQHLLKEQFGRDGTVIANPFDLVGLELSVIAAVVLGGARLTGGYGTLTGTLLGVALIVLVSNSLIVIGIPSTWQSVTIGLLILLGTGLPAWRAKRAAAGAA